MKIKWKFTPKSKPRRGRPRLVRELNPEALKGLRLQDYEPKKLRKIGRTLIKASKLLKQLSEIK